jgi:hypothetical protein
MGGQFKDDDFENYGKDEVEDSVEVQEEDSQGQEGEGCDCGCTAESEKDPEEPENGQGQEGETAGECGWSDGWEKGKGPGAPAEEKKEE